MSTAKNFIAFVVIGLYFCTILAAPPVDCNRAWCPGPLYYYEELGCSPIFNSTCSCCPKRYNCDNWKNLPKDKCLVNGHLYETNEPLRPSELQDPCLRCNYSSFGRFMCERNNYEGLVEKEPGCYLGGGYLLDCGTSIVICNDSPVTCTVDGRTYKAGETFKPHAEPEKTCLCLEGYAGVNSEAFCAWKKPSWCGNAVLNTNLIRRQCAPVYEAGRSLQADCNYYFICLINDNYVLKNLRSNLYGTTGDSEEDNVDDDDAIIKRPSDHHGTTVGSQKDSENHCVLGNSTIRLGDELRDILFEDVDVTCICEVPPVPTCRYIYR